MDENIKVSICCLAYNHEPYIRQMLESLIHQKTNFNYEILVHDDASTDSTTDIIKEYEKKYPNLIKPIFQKENQHSKGVRISWEYQYSRAKGKYIAFCEGDDFWCDDNRLQKQYDIMEENPDCSICTGRVKMITEQAEDLGKSIPHIVVPEGKYSPSEQIYWYTRSEPVIFHISSMMIKTEYITKILNDRPDFIKKSRVGDRPLLLYMACCGNLYHINDTVSCYRWLSKGSWSSRNLTDRKKTVNILKNIIEYYSEFDLYTNKKYENLINEYIEYSEFFMLMIEYKYRQIAVKKNCKYIKKLNLKQKILFFAGLISPKIVKYYYELKEEQK